MVRPRVRHRQHPSKDRLGVVKAVSLAGDEKSNVTRIHLNVEIARLVIDK
jgi:hypothetical protein